MINVNFGSRKLDLNGLRRVAYESSRERLNAFYTPDGIPWLNSYLDGDIEQWQSVAGQIKEQCEASQEELGWADALQGLVGFLGHLKTELPKLEASGDMGLVFGLADRYEELIRGYVEDRDPDCPACPDKKPGASWESWNKKIHPRTTVQVLSQRHLVPGNRGISYPEGYIRD